MSNAARPPDAGLRLCIGRHVVQDNPDLRPRIEAGPDDSELKYIVSPPPFLCDPEWRRYYVLEGAAQNHCEQARGMALQLYRCDYLRFDDTVFAYRRDLKNPWNWLRAHWTATEIHLSSTSRRYAFVRLLCPFIPALSECYAAATEPVSESTLFSEYGETSEQQSDLENLYRLQDSEDKLTTVDNALNAIWAFAESKELGLREVGNENQCPFGILMNHLATFRRAMVKFNSPVNQSEFPDANPSDIKGQASAEMKQVIAEARNVIDKLMQTSKQDFWAQWPTPTRAEVVAVAARKLGVAPGEGRPCDICLWL